MQRPTVFRSAKRRDWPEAAFVARIDLVAIGGKAEAADWRPDRRLRPITDKVAIGFLQRYDCHHVANWYGLGQPQMVDQQNCGPRR